MQCPICTSECSEQPSVHIDTRWLTCVRCGDFLLPGTYRATLPSSFDRNEIDRTQLSHHLRKMQSTGKPVMVNQALINDCRDRTKRPTPAQQLDDLILWIGSNQPSYDRYAETDARRLAAMIGAAVE